jgi:HEAT repeat protein
LAAYLETDGHGGWRKNEKAATELEKLSAEERKSVWTMLEDADPQIRRAASVYLLPLLDPSHPGHVAAFTRLLTDSDRIVRARGLDGVRQFSLVDQLKTLPQLTALLDARQEDRPENRAAAARLLGSLKDASIDALSGLTTAAEADPDPKVRAAALAAAASVSTSTPVIQTLAQSLQDQDASVRLVAASRLRQIGAAASPAAPALAKALADQSSEVAEAAAEALIRIGPPAVEPLAAELSTNGTEAKKLALAALIKIGPPAKSATTAIEKCKQDKDPQVRQLAETALKRLTGK